MSSLQVQSWENTHQTQAWGKHPPENLVRWIARNYPDRQARRQVKVLDLGCGAGACTWFLAEEGFVVSGIDASRTAIATAQQYLSSKQLVATLTTGCMSLLPYADQDFDLVIDMCSMGILHATQIRETLHEIYRVLKPGGRYFGFCMGDQTTISGEIDPHDPAFYTRVTSGPLLRSATARLFTEAELRHFFAAFQWLNLEMTTRSEASQTELVHRWWLTVQK